MLQSQPWYHVGEFIATQYNLFYSSAGQPVVMCERDFWLLQTFRLLFSEQVMRTGPGWGHCHWLFQFQRCSLTHFNYTRKDFTSWPQTPGKKTLGVLLPQAPFSPPKSHPFVFCKFSSFIFFLLQRITDILRQEGRRGNTNNYYSLKMMTQTIGTLQFHGPWAEPHLLNIRNSAMYTSSYIQIKFIN